MPRLPSRELQGPRGETSAAVRARVSAARQRQLARQGCTNAQLDGAALDRHCRLGPAEEALLRSALDRLGLSARGYHRILRVARSIADLAATETIAAEHLGEALGYRNLDRLRN